MNGFNVNHDPMHNVSLPKHTYKILITDEMGLVIMCKGKPPNWFQRKMYWLCFGWTIIVL